MNANVSFYFGIVTPWLIVYLSDIGIPMVIWQNQQSQSLETILSTFEIQWTSVYQVTHDCVSPSLVIFTHLVGNDNFVLLNKHTSVYLTYTLPCTPKANIHVVTNQMRRKDINTLECTCESYTLLAKSLTFNKKDNFWQGFASSVDILIIMGGIESQP